jgi:hypothetical protein
MSRPFTVFYSWQSDFKPTNHNFISDALDRAVKKLTQAELDIAIDRDTQNMPGSPNISQAIFQKIEMSDAFVCDASIINLEATLRDGRSMRPVPNPNVLIELGYAIRVLGWERIVVIVNEAWGDVTMLPFDINRQRALRYNLPLGTEKAEARKSFVEGLSEAITRLHDLGPRTEIRPPVPSLATEAVEKLHQGRADASLAVRDLWRHWMSQLESMAPQFDPKINNASRYEITLKEALLETLSLTSEFGRIATAIADAANENAARALYDGFKPLAIRYEAGFGPNGVERHGDLLNCDGDFFRFIGHEWFVMFIAALLRAERRALIKALLERKFIFAPYGQSWSQQEYDFNVLNQPLFLFHALQPHSHGALLKKRHENEPLSGIVDWRELWEADYFLFLYGQLNDPQWEARRTGLFYWMMQTATHVGTLPAWATTWQRRAAVEHWLPAFGVGSVEEFKQLLQERRQRLDAKLWFSSRGLDINPDLIAFR